MFFNVLNWFVWLRVEFELYYPGKVNYLTGLSYLALQV